MQIRLTVQATRGGAAARGRDVIVTAPAGTTLGAVAGGLLDAAAAAASGGGGTASGTGGAGVPVYAGQRLLDPDRTLLGEPPLVDGAVLSLGGPAGPGHGQPSEADATAVISLRVVAGPDAGGVHLLHGGQIRVGRSADADVPLDDPDVSRLHCALTVTSDGRITVEDLGSTNGTTVDGTTVGRTPVPLTADAVLRVGESALRIASPAGRGGAGSGSGSGSLEHSRVPEQRRPHEGDATTRGLGGGWPAGGGPEYGGTGPGPGHGQGSGYDGGGAGGAYAAGGGAAGTRAGTAPGGSARGAGRGGVAGPDAGHGGERDGGHPGRPGPGRQGTDAGTGHGHAGADRTYGGEPTAHGRRDSGGVRGDEGGGAGGGHGSAAAGDGRGSAGRSGRGTGTQGPGAGGAHGSAAADPGHGGTDANGPGAGGAQGSPGVNPRYGSGHSTDPSGPDRGTQGPGAGAAHGSAATGGGHGSTDPNGPGAGGPHGSPGANPRYGSGHGSTDPNGPGRGIQGPGAGGAQGSAAAGGGHGSADANGPGAGSQGRGAGGRHGSAAAGIGRGDGHGSVDPSAPGTGARGLGAGAAQDSPGAGPRYGDSRGRADPSSLGAGGGHGTAAADSGYGDGRGGAERSRSGAQGLGAGAAHGSPATDDGYGDGQAAPGRPAPDDEDAYGAESGAGRGRGRAGAEGAREPDGAARRRGGTPTRGTVVPPELRPRDGTAGPARPGAADSVPQPPRRGIRAWARRLGGGREDAVEPGAAAAPAARTVPERIETTTLHDRYPDAAAILLAALSNEAAYQPGFAPAPTGTGGAAPASYAYTPDDRSGDSPAHHPAHPGDTAPGVTRAADRSPYPGAAAGTPAQSGAAGGGFVFRRGVAHSDALVLRLGTEFRPGGGTAPVTVDLRRAGSLALAGPRPRLAGLARSVVAQLAALHAPDALELVLIAADPGRPHESRVEDWSWAGWLPHVRPRQGQDCRLLLAYDREQAAARVGELQRRLEQPQPGTRSVVVVDGDPGTSAVRDAVARLAERGPAAGVHVVCLAETSPATPASPLTATYAAASAAAPGFAACGAVGLLSGDVATGLRLLLRPSPPSPPSIPPQSGAPGAGAPPAEAPYDAAHGPADVPTHDPADGWASPATAYGTGRARLRDDGFPAPAELSAAGGWFEVAASGQRAGGPAGTVDAVSAAWAERLARALAPYGERDDADGAHALRRGGALPGAVRLLDELDLARATPTALTARWLESRSGAPRVGAVLGAAPGERLTADLAAGPLAVEGAARGGKSELLRSFAAALAAGEPPERLQLVLVDGAGRERGDALGAAADLPHVSGYLVAADPVRMREFAQELGAEFKRRAALYAPEGGPAPQGPAIPGPRSGGEPRPGGAADVQAPPSNTLRLRPRADSGEAPGTGTGTGSEAAPGPGGATDPAPRGAGGRGTTPPHGTRTPASPGRPGATPPYGTPAPGATSHGTAGASPLRGGTPPHGTRTPEAARRPGATPPHGLPTPGGAPPHGTPAHGAAADPARSTATAPVPATAPAGRRADPPAVVLLVDDFDALVAPALGSPARPAAGSVVRVVEAIARDGGPLGMHLVTASARPEKTADTAAVSGAAHHVVLGGDDVPPGRGLLCGAGAEPVPFQAARVTGRIPRTATARPTVVPLEWARMGSPPTSRPLRELGNGPTDLALLASALQRAAGSAAAAPAGDSRTSSS